MRGRTREGQYDDVELGLSPFGLMILGMFIFVPVLFRRNSLTARAVEMDSGPWTDPLAHKKNRTRTLKIKVRKNADPIGSGPLGPRSARTGPNCPRTVRFFSAKIFFFFNKQYPVF